MERNSTVFYHFVAFLTVAVWGTTFVSTKVLINNGLSPAQIFLLRFSIAYILMLCVYHKRWFADNLRDELIFLALGITGGSMYFLTENEALRFSTATNVSIIVCSCPLVTTLLIGSFYHSERFRPIQIIGSVIAFLGMATVVLNGKFVLHLSPVGDTLAFCACLCWAVYSLFMKKLSDKYSTLFVTRKIFFYGVLTILPYFIFTPGLPSTDTLMRPQVIGNLLFLGCIASMICFFTWNWCLCHLGVVKASNWIYFNPITTMVFASLVLNEHITIYFLVGAVLILLGMFIADKKR